MNSLTMKLAVSGMGFTLDGKPITLRGISFFNALFNEEFNRDQDTMNFWLGRFKAYGINFLRVWCYWNFPRDTHHFVDNSEDSCLFTWRGDIKQKYAERLERLLETADKHGMVIETVAFSQERFALLPPKGMHYPEEIIPVQERQLEGLVRLLMPYRNNVFQIWNECSFEVMRYFNIAKSIDPDKIITNSPGGAGVLGDERQNKMLDILTPHTFRRGNGVFWEEAPKQIKQLMDTYKKPVFDDEPARGGLVEHGGIEGGTKPEQHIKHIKSVLALGASHLYHHDMFQNGAGHPCTPPTGIPDPEFSPFHRKVLEETRDL